MPFKKSYRRRKRRAPYRKRYNRYPKSNPMNRITLLGNKRMVKLRYATPQVLTVPINGNINDVVIVANGCFDPEVSLGGHQPRGFDQMMQLYDHYTVLGSKCTGRWGQASAGNGARSFYCFITLRDSAILISNPTELFEDRNTAYTIYGAAGGSSRLIKNYSAKKFHTKGDVLDDNNLRGDEGANPVESGYFHVGTSNTDFTSAETEQIELLIVVDYIVMFSEPKQPPES